MRQERATRRDRSVRGPTASSGSSKLLGATTKPTFTLSPPRFTTTKTITIFPQFQLGHPANGAARDGSGANGDYQVTFVLGIPGFWNARPDQGVPIIDQGDSLIAVEPQITSLQLNVADPDNPDTPRRATIAINENHHLKYIRTTVSADGFRSAHRLAHDIIMPTISRLAYVHDVAIDVIATEIVDLTSHAFSVVMKYSGAVQQFSDVRGHSSERQERLLSAYRHGISSTEPAFQALSFFRVIEACYRLRGDRIAETKERGERPNEPSEEFPVSFGEIARIGYEDSDEPAFSQYLGMKFTRVRDTLNSRVRNLLAHLDVSREILHPDDLDNANEVETVVPVLHYMARILLSAELQHLTLAN